MKNIFKATITEIGPLVKEFIDSDILVFFGEGAPPELVEFSIIHNGKLEQDDVTVGNINSISDSEFKVLAVGDVANLNFKNLGHIIIKFNGKNKTELPGDICVEKKPLPSIKVGDEIKIYQI